MSKDTLQLSNEPSINAIGYAHFMKRVIEDGIPYVKQDHYTANGASLDDIADRAIVHSIQTGTEDMVLVHDNGALLRVYRNFNDVNYIIGATTRDKLVEASDWIRSSIPEFEQKDENVVPITFWSLGHNGPQSINRRIDVPKWHDIEDNYEVTVQEKLQQMMEGFKPSHGGQLIIWEGHPGTGKTYSLRALAQAWREWAKFHYITDPEEFFGHASYMINVLLQDGDPYFFDEEEDPKKKDVWKVLILEDCGELLSADAKERSGQAVSRLLNVVDGMIGQGLKILVLVTTNEPVKKFHPAVTRPGRCAIHLTYESLEINQANKWLKDHGSNEIVDEPSSIAELFGKLEGYSTEVEQPVGFGFK